MRPGANARQRTSGKPGQAHRRVKYISTATSTTAPTAAAIRIVMNQKSGCEQFQQSPPVFRRVLSRVHLPQSEQRPRAGIAHLQISRPWRIGSHLCRLDRASARRKRFLSDGRGMIEPADPSFTITGFSCRRPSPGRACQHFPVGPPVVGGANVPRPAFNRPSNCAAAQAGLGRLANIAAVR